MIKRLTAFTLGVMLTVIFISGCSNSKNEEIVGDWIPTSASLDGTTVQFSSLGIEEDSFRLTFNSDDSCTVVLTGITTDGTYTFNNTAIDIKSSDSEYKLVYENNTITLSLDYDTAPISINFTKEK